MSTPLVNKSLAQRFGKPCRPHESETHGICHSYLKTGKCEHGSDCKYLHVEGLSLATGKDTPKITQSTEKATHFSKELAAKIRSTVVVRTKKQKSKDEEDENSTDQNSSADKIQRKVSDIPDEETKVKSKKSHRSRSSEDTKHKKRRSSRKKSSKHHKSRRRRRHSYSSSSTYTSSTESSSSDSSHHRHRRSRRYRRNVTPRHTDWINEESQQYIQTPYDSRTASGLQAFPIAGAVPPSYFEVTPFPLAHEQSAGNWPQDQKINDVFYRYSSVIESPTPHGKSTSPLRSIENSSNDEMTTADINRQEKLRRLTEADDLQCYRDPIRKNEELKKLREMMTPKAIFSRIGFAREYLSAATLERLDKLDLNLDPNVSPLQIACNYIVNQLKHNPWK